MDSKTTLPPEEIYAASVRSLANCILMLISASECTISEAYEAIEQAKIRIADLHIRKEEQA